MNLKQTAAIAAIAIAASTVTIRTLSSTAPTLHVSGAVRCSAGVYSAIDDSGHDPFGITSVTTMSDRVRVNYSAMTAVSSTQVTADETYADNEVVPGASVGLDHTDILLYKAGVKVDPASVCYSGSNVWITGWKS